MHATLAWPQN